ncbi:MAG: polysaccharide biosynthesis C-terminal domain-containing protein [Ignavibacteriae bacterium]|nr:polysaccharide biosynthesis C-terminal domain-containing protein [Ignavibacteria bacterium]MBI3364699.1 polysaccharide biosynthesis C-terminal domain-containing protein [Ignavibacteriota bacterium]
MFDKIKRLGSETAIYGASTILSRFLNFLLVPFYTNVLVPGEFGIVSYIYSMIAFVNVIYSYGMESAYFKYASTMELGTEKQNFSTPFLSLFMTSVLFSFAIVAAASPIVGALKIPPEYKSIVLYAAGILALDAIAIIPFASLRMEHRAKLFATVKFLNILTNVVMNVLLLAVFHKGVTGIFISGFVASALTVVLLLPTILRHLIVDMKNDLLGALVRFGLPSIPAGLAAMAVQVIDRPILRSLTDDATVGIYQANYRLGIFMMLIVQMYDYAWRPFYFSMAKEENAKEVFARVLTYIVLLMSVVFLVLTFFIGDIVKISIFGRHLIHQNYWGGLNIVPIVLLGYLFLGMYTNISAGLYIEKKTNYLPIITLIAAAVNIAANYTLIPSMGMLGAAWATFWAYLAMAIAGYFFAQRVYPVRYEWGRMAKLLIALGVSVGVSMIFPFDELSQGMEVALKVGLLGVFALMLFAMRFFRGGETVYMKRMFLRLRGLADTTIVNEQTPSSP